MKQISFRVRNFDKEQYLTFNIDNEAELDEEVLDFLEEEEPEGIVPVIFEEGEEFDTFSYDVTDKIHLSELSEQEINAEMVLLVLRGLILALLDMAEYRVPVSYLVLNRHYIYIDSDYKVEFVCIPLEDMQGDVDVSHFLRNFLASLRFESSENGDYVAKLFTYINNHAIFNLRNMLTLVEDLMENMGIEIPDDDANEIYAEYQEVGADTTVLTEEEPEPVQAMDDLEAAEALEEAEDLEEVMQDLEDSSEEDAETTGELVEEESEEEVQESDPEEEDVAEGINGNAATEDAMEEKEEPVVEKPETEEPEDAEEKTEANADETVAEEPEDAVEEGENDAEPEDSSETEDAKAKLLDAESQEIVNKLKEKLSGAKKEKPKTEEKKEPKKPAFKTKDTSSVGVVIQDDLDEFLAEKELEEQMAHHEESGLKIRKNIKVSRASIVKNTQEELKAAEEQKTAEAPEEPEEDEVMEVVEPEEEEVVSNSILSQTISGATGLLKGNVSVPKVNPYLIRVNTDERIMITKQNFKIGKASMGVDYSVKGNGAVSRVHAVITNKDGIYYIRDNKSTNHTFVNGKTLEDGENELLTQDCKIVLGDEEFIFKLR
ncbi:MAG: FHA domain-containing protein [Clostridiales bacterium]|nr:FHA domain-containing protein [Clostridiales bacterium]